jgi:mono/diheme cytochrome c family protein
VAIGLLSLGTAGLIGLTVFAIATDVRMTEPEQVVAKAPAPAEFAGPIQRADVTRLYNDNCTACHGVDGSGKQIRAGMPTIPDFTSLAWQMSQTDVEITHRIQDGNEPLMPAYRDKLSQQQILAMTVYVRAFAVGPTEVAAPKPAQPPAPVAAGMPPVQVYRAYCLACHDANGSGQVARKAMPDLPDFTDPKWQGAHGDAELKQSVLDGKGKFMLPMKDKLSQADAEHMVAYVRAFQGGKQVIQVEPQPPIVPPPPREPKVVIGPKAPPAKQPSSPPVSAEMAARTRVATGLYRQFCLVCHGADGRGSEMRASMPTIPNFTDGSWQEEVGVPQLVASILDGKGTLMPAFRGRITDEQGQDLAAYVRAFGPVELAQPQVPASDFEKQFRDVQAHWYELQKQLRELSKPPPKP